VVKSLGWWGLGRTEGGCFGPSVKMFAAKGFLKELQELKEDSERESKASGRSSSSEDKKKKKKQGKKGKAKATTGAKKKKQNGGSDTDQGDGLNYTAPLSVLLYPHPKLRATNLTVTEFDDRLAALSREMFKVMYDTEGIGLAAPQVGVNVRLFVWNPTGEASEKDQETVLVNPRYVSKSKGQTLFEEGCLSFPEILGDVKRPKSVLVEYQDLSGETCRMSFEGLEARIFQHEYDHLEGVLFHDRMHPSVFSDVKDDLLELERKFEEENPGVTYQGI